MEAVVSVIRARDSVAELGSLSAWLRGEDILRGRIKARSPVHNAEDMGIAADALIVALGVGGAGTVLAGALGTWLQNRGTDLRIKIDGPCGSLELEARRLGDPERLVAQILDLLEPKAESDESAT